MDLKQLDWIALDTLRPLEQNARVHSEEQLSLLAESLRRYGVYRPLVVHRETRQILAGNGLYEAARRVGYQQLPVLWFDGSLEEGLSLSLTDNRLGELSDWDYSALAVLSRAIEEASVPLVSDAEFMDILAGLTQTVSELSSAADPFVWADESELESESESEWADESESESELESESESEPAPSREPESEVVGVYVVRVDARAHQVLSRWSSLLRMPIGSGLILAVLMESEALLNEAQ